MSLTDTIDRIETSSGEAMELERTIRDLKDHLNEISAQPTPHDWDKVNSLMETIMEQAGEVKGTIEWSRDMAKESQSELDQAYSIMQNML
jgi:archaellum component FlaC